MNNEEFISQVEQALIEDIRLKEDGINRISKIMEEMPILPFKDMAPLIQKVFIHYFQLELAMEYITVMKKVHELGKKRGYGSVNAIFASSPFSFLVCDKPDMKSPQLFEHMKKEMGEEYVKEHKIDGRLARVCAEDLFNKLKPLLPLLSPDISKHKSEYNQMIDKLVCMNPGVDETNTFTYDISKYLADTVSCWIACMRSFGFDDRIINKALRCIKGKLADFPNSLTQQSEGDYLKRLSTCMERIKDPDAAFRRDYEYCWGRSEDDLHRESVKRPSDNKLSGIRLTLDEYEEINFLDDDNEDPTPNPPMAEEGDPQGPPEDDPKDPENPEDEDDSEYNWDQNYDEYNLW